MQNTSCKIPDWIKHKLESRLLGGNINNLRYAYDTTLMAESEEKLKSLLMKVMPIEFGDLKEINPEYSLEGLMLKLKLQYFGHLIQKADSLEKTLMLGKIEGRRRG